MQIIPRTQPRFFSFNKTIDLGFAGDSLELLPFPNNFNLAPDRRVYKIHLLEMNKNSGGALPDIRLNGNGSGIMVVPFDKLTLDKAAANLYHNNISGTDATNKLYIFPQGLIITSFMRVNVVASAAVNVSVKLEISY